MPQKKNLKKLNCKYWNKMELIKLKVLIYNLKKMVNILWKIFDLISYFPNLKKVINKIDDTIKVK